MSQTAWAGALVVLSFSCSWVLPPLTSLVAGDVFATEDRLAGLAASAVVGGLAAVGNRPLVGVDGHLLAPGQATGAVLLAWASALAPTS